MKHKKFLTTILLGYLVTIIALGQSDNPDKRYVDAYKQYLVATCPLEKDSIMHFVYFSRDRELIHNHTFLKVKRIAGAQIMYSWKQLEPKKGEYDFSIIYEDYNYLLSHGKKLFIQFQDVTFDTNYIAIPNYLLTEEFERGCTMAYNDNSIADGW